MFKNVNRIGECSSYICYIYITLKSFKHCNIFLFYEDFNR